MLCVLVVPVASKINSGSSVAQKTKEYEGVVATVVNRTKEPFGIVFQAVELEAIDGYGDGNQVDHKGNQKANRNELQLRQLLLEKNVLQPCYSPLMFECPKALSYS